MGFKHRHRNEEAIIVANGPGLARVPLDFLYSRPTFASNYISLLPDFIPTYLTVADAEAVVGNIPEEEKDYFEVDREPEPERMALIEPVVPMVENFFVLHTVKKYFAKYANVQPLYNVKAACFSHSPLRYLFTGGTCTYVNLQLAFYMGFSAVFIVGLDHDYSMARHFSNDYLHSQKVEDIERQMQTLKIMERSYWMARRAYEVIDRPLINVSAFSNCPCFLRARPPWLVTGEYDSEHSNIDELTRGGIVSAVSPRPISISAHLRPRAAPETKDK